MAVMPMMTVVVHAVDEDAIGRRVQVVLPERRAAGRIVGIEAGLARVAWEDLDGATVGVDNLPYSREPRSGHWTDVVP